MSSWQLSYNQGGVYISGDVSFRNVLGAPLVSVSKNENTSSPSGIFVVTVISPTTVSITAKDIQDLKSPVLWLGVKTIVADGTTQNYNVIPGIGVIFGSGGLVAGLIAEIGVGCVWDTSILSWRRLTSLGLGVSGVSGSNVTISLTNLTGNDQSGCKIVAFNGISAINSNGLSPFSSFRQIGNLNPTSDLDANGTSVVFDAVVSGGSHPIAIMRVGGDNVSLFDVTNNVILSAGYAITCDGVSKYRFTDSSKFQSCEFSLSPSIQQTDTATLYVSDGGDFVQFYDSYTATYVSGSTGVYVNSDNCGEGIVLSGDTVSCTLRLNPPVGRDITLNQRQISFRIFSVGV